MSFWNVYKGKRVLITGDTGFKGSWLAMWLLQQGADVYGYALPPDSELTNYTACQLSSSIEHQDGDVRNLSSLSSFFKRVQPDFAFHLAAQPIVIISYHNPVETFETNLIGTVNFFEAVRRTPSVKVAINVTSDKCYANNEWLWGYREIDPMGGKDPYSASKGCSELITASYHYSFFNLDASCKIASARAGNVIGGGDWAANRIIPDYFRARRLGEKVEVRYPHATRPWQHVLEPLSGYLNLAARLYLGGNDFTGGWNFGPEDSANYSVSALLDEVIELDGGGYTVPYDANKLHEAHLLKLDISKSVNLLAWKPVLSFKETVSFTVEGYQAQLNQSNLLEHRNRQIELYEKLASAKDISWSNDNTAN